VTLSKVDPGLSYSMVMPHDALANSSTLAQSVQCNQTWIINEFASGVQVYAEKSQIADPLTNWQAAAANDAEEASFTYVDGQPALLIDPAADPSHEALGSVTFVLSGTQVTILGTGKLPLDRLVAIGNTVKVTADAAPSSS
jgi:hypothetical protein